MKRERMILALVLSLCLLGSSIEAQPAEWVDLFDGKTLKGWEVQGGKAKYKVDDGTIVGTTVKGSPNTFLCTEKEYGDFILEFETMNDPPLNSGVQIRSHVRDDGHVYGYQVEITNEGQPGASGGVWDEARRGRWLDGTEDDPVASQAFKPGEWNHYRVECMGDAVKTWVNGVACADFHDATDLTGLIGLQVHSYGGKKPVKARWRNIRIQDFGCHAWEPIWDGKTTDGWSKLPGGTWEVKDGVIEGSCIESDPNHGLLLSDAQYGDVTVRLRFKAIKGNSGFYFRSEKVDHAVGVNGFQAEIGEPASIGGLYETGGRAWVVQPSDEDVQKWYKAGEWNEMVVSAYGPDVVVHVNGHVTAELKNDEGRRVGHLGLQLHGGQDMAVQFKDIEVLVPKDVRWAEPFNGKSLEGWKAKGPADHSKWKVGVAAQSAEDPKLLDAKDGEGEMINLASKHGDSLDFYTEAKYGDCHIELEIMVPQNSNSGVYVMGEYEIQVLDSWGRDQMGNGDMGAIYGAAPPPFNACKAPGEWQKYVIDFKAPRFDKDGKKIANAKFLKVELNGKILHSDLEMPKLTPGGVRGKEQTVAPLMFQGNHGPVAYRNIKIRPLNQ